MLSKNNSHGKCKIQENRNNNPSDDGFEDVRNRGKLMCRINIGANQVEIVKEKDRKTLITFLPDCTIIENQNNSDALMMG